MERKSLFALSPLEGYQRNVLVLSVLCNGLLGIGKVLLSLFFGVFFLLSGVINLAVVATKLVILLSRNAKKERHDYFLCVALMAVASLFYGLDSLKTVFFGKTLLHYPLPIAAIVAFVSFFEIGLAVFAVFRSGKGGGLFRVLKVANLFTSVCAIVLTAAVLLPLGGSTDGDFLAGVAGMAVGLLFFLVFLFLVPVLFLSPVDNSGLLLPRMEPLPSSAILLTSRFFGTYSVVFASDPEGTRIGFLRER